MAKRKRSREEEKAMFAKQRGRSYKRDYNAQEQVAKGDAIKDVEIEPIEKKEPRLNSPPTKPKPTKVTGHAVFKDGKLVTPKQTHAESHTKQQKEKHKKAPKEQAVIKPIEKAGKKTYEVYVSDGAELLEDGFTSKKKAIKYARSQGFSYSRK